MATADSFKSGTDETADAKWGYFAGLLDSSAGQILVDKDSRTVQIKIKPRNWQTANVKNLVKRLEQECGAAEIEGKYTAVVSGSSAIKFLRNVAPRSVLKSQEAEEALKIATSVSS